MTCETCGQALQVGDWPFCPHGAYHGAVIDDSIPGGQVIEHLGDEPMTFYSKRAILEEADRRGLRLRDQWAGPSDTQLSNWGAGIDAYTLDAAKVLVSRGVRAKEPDVRCETLQTSIREITKWSEVA